MIYGILRQRREIILKEWQKSTLDFYATGAFKSAKKSVDRFGNPIVYTVSTGLETILDELIEGIHTAKTDEALEDIVKIRSLQSEKPSQALDFLFCLKKIINDKLNCRKRQFCGNREALFGPRQFNSRSVRYFHAMPREDL
jgi:hypothetical protein